LACHTELDGAQEKGRGKKAIGTTKRGIGPTYTDKSARIGIRAGTMKNSDKFIDKVHNLLERKNRLLVQIYGQEPVDIESKVADYQVCAEKLTPYLTNVSLTINQALEAGKQLLCEGAQGTLLDIDHGTYPYVTSSNPTVGGAMTGLGFGPCYVQRVVGVTKAYTTRVGKGPFPTKLENKIGKRIRKTGHEYGATTGRPRDCGWLDAVALRYAVQVNGFTHLAMNKLDILSGLGPIKVAVAYRYQDKIIKHFPIDTTILEACTPKYVQLPGWSEDIRTARTRSDLPQSAQSYIAWVEDFVGVPLMLVGVGPEREEAIFEDKNWLEW
jgi:adenylosuccinate synthase